VNRNGSHSAASLVCHSCPLSVARHPYSAHHAKPRITPSPVSRQARDIVGTSVAPLPDVILADAHEQPNVREMQIPQDFGKRHQGLPSARHATKICQACSLFSVETWAALSVGVQRRVSRVFSPRRPTSETVFYL